YAIARAESLLELRLSEERYALAVRGARDGIWDWSPDTGQVYYSPRWKEMLGYAEAELEPRIEEWLDRIHPDDRERVSMELYS
ncbi:diguanylate cyclase, partial [Enterococcus hirae]